MSALALYALVSAAVLGWLLHKHLTARHRTNEVPLHILVLMPLLWLPALIGMLLLVIVAIVANAWRNWRRA